MTRTHRHSKAARIIAAAITTTSSGTPLLAREAHLVAGTTSAWTEIQGANGPILAPNSTFTYPYLPYGPTASGAALNGIATDGTNAYFLVTTADFFSRTTSDAIWTYNLATGTRTTTTPIQRPAGDPGLTDIALLSGTLYAVSGPTSPTANGTTRIYNIGTTGTLTNVYSRTDTTAATPQIAANSQSNRLVLLPTSGPNASPFTNTPQVLLNPSNWTVAQSVSGTAAGQISFNLDGSRIAEYLNPGSLSPADTYTVPGFTRVSPTPQSFGQAGPTFGSAISDAFDYAYPSTSPAVVRLSEYQQTFNPLYRTGQHSWQASTLITNYAAPDATTVDQVAATNLIWTQTAGPAVQTSTTFSPTGALAMSRSVAETTFTVDTTGASRGGYVLRGTATLQGHYTAPGTDTTRPLTIVNTNLIANFAIDPVSSNFVGNGDLELGPYGWTGFGPYYNTKTKSNALLLFPSDHSSQALELGTPQSPMMLSFDYNVAQSDLGTADLTATLAGIQVAFIPGITDSSGVQHFSVYLSDPQLQGLSNPVLDFQDTSKSFFTARIYVDNISLIAVPEPATLSLTALAALPLFHRRRR